MADAYGSPFAAGAQGIRDALMQRLALQRQQQLDAQNSMKMQADIQLTQQARDTAAASQQSLDAQRRSAEAAGYLELIDKTVEPETEQLSPDAVKRLRGLGFGYRIAPNGTLIPTPVQRETKRVREEREAQEAGRKKLLADPNTPDDVRRGAMEKEFGIAIDPPKAPTPLDNLQRAEGMQLSPEGVKALGGNLPLSYNPDPKSGQYVVNIPGKGIVDVSQYAMRVPPAALRIEGAGTAALAALPDEDEDIVWAASHGPRTLAAADWRQTSQRFGKLVDDKQRFDELVRQTTMRTEGIEKGALIAGRQATIDSLDQVEKGLNDLKASGFDTNIFNGTAEKIANKIGTTTNPQLKALANRVLNTLIEYRRASTGVQFGEKEQASYDAMFPSTGNAYEVNIAQLKGLRQAMQDGDASFWVGRLGPKGAARVLALPRFTTRDLQGLRSDAQGTTTTPASSPARAGFKVESK